MPRQRPISRTRPLPPSRALPATVAELEAQRLVTRKLKLSDEVEQVYLVLYEDINFRKYRGLDDPDQTVEDDPVVDDVVATQIIQKKAIEMGSYPQITAAKLGPLMRALRVAERRLNASRTQRDRVEAA